MDSISIREAAERLGVSHKVIRRLISQGALDAQKSPGAHGTEWRVSVPSLEGYRAGQPSRAGQSPRANGLGRVRLASPPSTSSSPLPDVRDGSLARTSEAVPPGLADAESLRADKAFLERQVEALTTLLSQALARTASPATSVVAASSLDLPLADPAPVPLVADGLAARDGDVTAALQSSLRSIGTEGIEALEMCSVRVLWGKPVLWRVVAHEPEDVARLLEAILAPEARWDLPGEEVVFVWALGAGGEILWGTACGPAWFGPAFEEVLRACRVERA